MTRKLEDYMKMAINEAKISLKEGNNGFGCVVVKYGEIIALIHDLDETEQDATAHAEINAIRKASKQIGKNLQDCILISTHEPCLGHEIPLNIISLRNKLKVI